MHQQGPHDERERLLRRVVDLETRLVLLGFHPSLRLWSFHRPRRPTPRCIAAYLDALYRVHPDLAWDDEDRQWRRGVLREVHEAFVDEDLMRLARIREGADLRSVPEDASRRVERHIGWLRLRLDELEDGLSGTHTG